MLYVSFLTEMWEFHTLLLKISAILHTSRPKITRANHWHMKAAHVHHLHQSSSSQSLRTKCSSSSHHSSSQPCPQQISRLELDPHVATAREPGNGRSSLCQHHHPYFPALLWQVNNAEHDMTLPNTLLTVHNSDSCNYKIVVPDVMMEAYVVQTTNNNIMSQTA